MRTEIKVENISDNRRYGIVTNDDEIIHTARKYDLYLCGRPRPRELSSISRYAIVWDWQGATKVIRTFDTLISAKFFLVDMGRALNSMKKEFSRDWQITDAPAFEKAMREAVRYALLRWNFQSRTKHRTKQVDSQSA